MEKEIIKKCEVALQGYFTKDKEILEDLEFLNSPTKEALDFLVDELVTIFYEGVECSYEEGLQPDEESLFQKTLDYIIDIYSLEKEETKDTEETQDISSVSLDAKLEIGKIYSGLKLDKANGWLCVSGLILYKDKLEKYEYIPKVEYTKLNELILSHLENLISQGSFQMLFDYKRLIGNIEYIFSNKELKRLYTSLDKRLNSLFRCRLS